MPTPSERKALIFLAALALSGSAVRAVRTVSGAPPQSAASREALTGQIAAVERSIAVKSAPQIGAPGAPATLDVDRASVEELQRLPGVGPVLAGRIKAFRDSAGPIGSLARFDSIKGVGPALLSKLSGKVTFSGKRRH